MRFMEESGERKPIDEGIEPEKELNTSCRVCKEDKSPIQFGRGPVRELYGRK